MSSIVWMTDAMTDTALTRHFKAPDSYYSDLPALAKTKGKLYSGALIDRSELPPDELVLDRVVGPVDPMPHFLTNSYVLISKELKDLLCEFDLGQTAFHPVKLFGLRKEKVLGPQYFYLNVAERKGSFDPKSSTVKKSPFSECYSANLLSEGTEVAVTSAAIGGVDIWMEEKLYGTIFLSDRLMQALSQSGYMPNARFSKCKVV